MNVFKENIKKDIKENIKYIISTRSYKFRLNCYFDLDIIKDIPREKYFIIKKIRGRRRKDDEIINVNSHLRDGTLVRKVTITLDNKEIISKKKKEFPNSKTFILFLIENGIEKLINFKVFDNGSIQMSGVKKIEQAFKTIETFFKIVKDYSILIEKKCIIMKNEGDIEIYCIPFLCNMSFNVGFMINREQLDEYININTGYKSHWEGVGYAAVRVYFPLENFEENIKIYRINFNGTWNYSTITYKKYLSIFIDEKIKKKYITFHIFHTGKINTSSIDDTVTFPYCDTFLDILMESRKYIEV